MSNFIQQLLFFALLFSLFAFMQWYVGKFFVRWVKKTIEVDKQQSWHFGGLIFIITANIIFSLRFLSAEYGFYDHLFTQALVIYPGGVFFAGITFAFAILLVSDIFRYGIKGVFQTSRKIRKKQPATKEENSYDPGRRRFLKVAGTAAVATPFVVTMSSSAATSRDYQVIRPELFFPDLPSGLDGFQLVQISDIHSGIYMTQRQIEEIFEISNSLNPQLVTLTGDLVDTVPSEIPAIYNTLPMLKSEYGVFSCLGNHDHYASGHRVTDAVRQRDVAMLNNSNQTLDINGEKLEIIGVDDAGSGNRNHARIEEALDGTDPDHFKMLLSHRPELFNDKRAANVDLTLAGHTHGGQIGGNFFGVPIYPVQLFHEYSKGLFKRGNQKLYVNVGVGMVGVPIRIVRPEITLITLRKGEPVQDVPGIG